MTNDVKKTYPEDEKRRERRNANYLGLVLVVASIYAFHENMNIYDAYHACAEALKDLPGSAPEKILCEQKGEKATIGNFIAAAPALGALMCFDVGSKHKLTNTFLRAVDKASKTSAQTYRNIFAAASAGSGVFAAMAQDNHTAVGLTAGFIAATILAQAKSMGGSFKEFAKSCTKPLCDYLDRGKHHSL